MARRNYKRQSHSAAALPRTRDIGVAMAVGRTGNAGTPATCPAPPRVVLPFRPINHGGISRNGPEERLLASDLASIQIASDTETEVAMYASEAGIVDLNRLYVQTSGQAATANLEPPFSQLTTGSNISQILVRDSEKLVFAGRTPASAFDGNFGYQGWREGGEPTVSLSSGDTIKVSTEQTSGANASFGFGAAFRPNSVSGRMVNTPWNKNAYCTWVGCDETTLSNGATTTLTATVTQAGWLSLSDICFNAFLTATSNDTVFDKTANCYVTSFYSDAYSSTNLVLSGSGKTACAPSVFFSGMRQHRYVRWPIVRADSGNTVTLKVHSTAGTDLVGAFSVPFYPLSQQLQPPCAPEC